ncbi:hypothetical protein DUI87_12283 [Hirundo rustica rustica]|uniref:Uncharacterized protein n=1 Tax=Hirundo rustica rustica TaxID=333673 RepID=A0A3M0KBJ4_HIRRU|nr:hypothetical protein DUI87_12283 [Hirundo rustica rustica]
MVAGGGGGGDANPGTGGGGINLAKNWNKMASVLQNVKATVAWRKHQLLADFSENESPVPDKFKRRASLNSLNTIRMSLRKRVPLKRVELNFRKTPTRKSLEPRQREFDCELELVSSGICQLKRISQAFDDAIEKEERQLAISDYYYLMAQKSQSVHRSLKPSQAIRRQAKKLHQALGTKTEMGCNYFFMFPSS